MDKLSLGYLLACVIVVGDFVALCVGRLGEAGFSATLGVAVAVATGTSYLRSREKHFIANVEKAATIVEKETRP